MIRTVIRRPVTITMVFLTIATLGIAAWRNIPIELLPDTQLPRLTVTAIYNGSSPEVMEAFVTSPLEAAIQQVRGVEKLTSTSTTNRSSLQIEFALDTDMEFARLELSERMASAEEDLPQGVRLSVEQYVPDDFQDQRRPLMQYTLTGPYTQERLREYGLEELAPDLQQLEGVSTVPVYGGRDRILEIGLDENKIRSLGLTPDQVRQRVSAMEIISEAGAVLTDDGNLRTLALRERTESTQEIERLPVLMDQSRVVRIADIGKVTATYEEPNQLYRINGFPAVQFFIIRAPGSNAVKTAELVRTRIEELARSHPSGIRVLLDYDQSEDIKAQLTDLRTRAMIAAVIVLAVLLLFLRSVRAAFIVFATVVFAVLITVNVMYWAGFSMNVLTLMGLAMGFGLVVDNAIVVLENTYRRRRLGESAMVAATRGASDVGLAILASTGTTLVVLIPFVYFQDELRIYYVPLAMVVGIALIASLLVAFTFIPSVGARLLGAVMPVTHADAPAPRNATEALIPPGLRRSFIVRSYGSLINGSLRWPWVTVVIALMALGGSYYVFDKYVSRGMIWGAWGDNRDRIQIQIIQPRGEEIARTDEMARFFEDRLRHIPEIESFTTNVQAQRGDINVYFPDSLQYTAIPVAIKEQMMQYSLLFGGTDVRVYGYGPSFYGGGGGSAPNYRIKILGYNYEQVRLIAEDLARKLERFSRVREVDTNTAGNWWSRDKATEIVVDIDRRRLALHNLSSQDVVRYVGSAIRGQSERGNAAGSVRLDGEEMLLSVKLQNNRDMDLRTLEGLLIPTQNSREGVRLASVANLYEREVLNQVIRENQQYQRLVSYEFRGPAKLGDRVLETVLAATELPPGYTIDERQTFSFSTEDKQQIWGVTIIAIILVYMVTAAVFESIKQPFCVLLTVPMALIGVFLVFFYSGANFTREAYVGVIMMSGIVVNNAILLVDHVNQLRRKEGLALHAALVRGTIERVRPILMTSLTTICGLLPLVLFAKNANANIWNSLAYVVIGGLASSTILVLTVTPALYSIFERKAEKRRVAALEAVAAAAT